MRIKALLALLLAVVLLCSLTACSDIQSGEASGQVTKTSEKNTEKQAKTDAASAATSFLSLLTELRWGEAANMTENELKTKMPGINDMEWGVPTDSDMAEYEEMLKLCMQNTRNIVADAENTRITDENYIVPCQLEMAPVRTLIDLIAQCGWTTVAEVETNINMLQDLPKETVQVTLLMKEEKGPSGLTDYKVCAASDISALSVIFE